MCVQAAHMERCAAVAAQLVHICAVLQQQAHQLCVAALSGQVQRGPSRTVGLARTHPLGQQMTHDGHMPVFTSDEQRGGAFVVGL